MEIIVWTNIPLIVTGDLDINYIAGKQVVFYAEVEIRLIVLGIESYPSVAAVEEVDEGRPESARLLCGRLFHRRLFYRRSSGIL